MFSYSRGQAGNTHQTGALYDMVAPSKDASRPVGQWNQSRILVKGEHVEHWLNGEKVCEAEIGSEEWNAKVAKSKWAKVTSYAKETKGKIDLQDHGNKVEFKNLKILALM